MNSTATQPNLLKLAKQGNAKAIAALMNRQLQPKGITVKVSLSGDYLTVVAESQEPPDQQFLVNFVRKGMTNLTVRTIKRVFVRGQVTGATTLIWRDAFDLPYTGLTQPATPSNTTSCKVSTIASFLEALRVKSTVPYSPFNRRSAVGLAGLATVALLVSMAGYLSNRKADAQAESLAPSVVAESTQSVPSQANSTDQEFIAAYKNAVVNVVKDPSLRKGFLVSLEKSPEAYTNLAKDVCNSLRSGSSMDEIMKIQSESVQAEANSSQALIVMYTFGMINAQAPTYYCPEFASAK